MGAKIVAAVLLAAGACAPAQADVPSEAVIKAAGEHIYKERCAACHDQPASKAPTRAQIGQLSIEDVAKVLLLGPMAPQAHGLSVQEIGMLATYVSQKAARPDPVATANMCAAPPALDLAGAQWNGWGRDVANSRYQPAPGLKAGDVGKLKLRWAFSYTGAMVYGQPTVIGDRVYVTSLSGRVQALDARTGCTIWTHETGAGTRTAITVAAAPKGGAGVPVAYVGGEDAVLHALNAVTGAELWRIKVDDHKAARITGAPVLFGGRVFVPVASSEEVGATAPYQCCSFRGSVVAVDAGTGKQVWKSYTVTQTPKPYAKAADGTQLLGPAGASVWSAPTIDAKKGVLYVGTSNSYTGVKTPASDAIIAMSLADGHIVWTNQVTTDDNFLVGCFAVKPPVCSFGICNGPGEAECPKTVGPDHDFGASPILVSLAGGKRMLVAGQKSGVVYGMDPDAKGHLIWKQKVGLGGPAGGIEWGMAADGHDVFAPSSDIYLGPPDQVGGLTALDVASGKVVWHVAPKPVCAWGKDNCWGSQSQAVTAIPGVVFGGGLDGHLRAFEAASGKVAWDFDAGGNFTTVNQGTQVGGSLNLGGPTVAGGMVFVNAGYGRFAGQSGHVLLAFGVGG